MSATQQTVPERTLSEKQRRILTHLREKARTKTYFKSRLIGEDLGMTAASGFRLLGRARQAELRGCSLATEELLGG